MRAIEGDRKVFVIACFKMGCLTDGVCDREREKIDRDITENTT